MVPLRHFALLACFTIAAHARAQNSSFITTLGRDTLSFEQFRRDGDSVTGDWVTLYGGIMYHHYVIRLRPDGTMSRYTLSLHRVSGKPDGSVDLAFDGDSITVTSDAGGGGPQRFAVHADGAVFANTIAPLETITTRARALGRDSMVVFVVPAFGPYRGGGAPIAFVGADSARLGNPRSPLYARVTRAGQILGLSARTSTTRTETVRVAGYDLSEIIKHFPNVSDETPIAGVLALSPRDTSRVVIAGATITIDYGRPAVRGRRVFANGVLGDTVWRVGANAATQFTTTSDLEIGGKMLPAGTYSLWVHVPPNDSSYDLVFNTQTGQWGTEHHFDRDLLSVPLKPRRLGAPVERLTFVFDSTRAGSTLRVQWADLELSAPVTVSRPH